MRVALLGSLRVESTDGTERVVPGHRARLLTALLASRRGAVVTIDEITDTLWPSDPPSANALHVQISKLRRTFAFEDVDAPLRTVERGYVLEVGPDDVDVDRFERLYRSGAEQMAAGRADDAVTTLDAALGLWRGPAFAEFTAEFAVLERHRLDELRGIAQEQRVDALLDCGRHELVIAELEESVAADPLRERRWAQLMTALYRSDRQADALRAFGRARRALIDEIGVEPGRGSESSRVRSFARTRRCSRAGTTLCRVPCWSERRHARRTSAPS